MGQNTPLISGFIYTCNFYLTMYFYSTQRLTESYSDVPPTISTHTLTHQGESITFSVLRGGKVRVGNKIHSRDYARNYFGVLLSRGWTKV